MPEQIKPVEFAVRDRSVVLDEAEVERLCRRILEGEGGDLSLSIVILGDDEIRRLNREFLGHDYAADVIAFDLRGEGGPDGELFVNGELARREARERGHAPEAELLFYIAHGVLHLLGYDDAADSDRVRMHEIQAKYLRILGRDISPAL